MMDNKGSKSGTATLYTANFNLFKLLNWQYQFFPIWMVQMLFSQIQQAPGPVFKMVGKFLASNIITYVSPINANSHISRGARGLNFGPSLHLHPYFVYHVSS